MVSPSSAGIIEYVDLVLKALEIVYHTNGATIEGLANRNGHRQKVVGVGKCVIWGGACTKVKVSQVRTHKKFLPQLFFAAKFFPETNVFHSLKTCVAN